jgi:uncharacterized membrane protein
MNEDQAPPSPPGIPPPPLAAPPPPPAGGASGNRGVMIVLSYLWILALIPLLVEKEDRDVQWHAKHGLVLTGAEFLLWIILFVLNLAITTVLPPVGCVTAIGFFLVWIAILVFHIMCMVKGVNGERLTVPYVSEYADRF